MSLEKVDLLHALTVLQRLLIILNFLTNDRMIAKKLEDDAVFLRKQILCIDD